MSFKKAMDKAIKCMDAEKKEYEFVYWNSTGSGYFASKKYKSETMQEAMNKFKSFADRVQASLSGLTIYENGKVIKKDQNWRNY